jgi:hypothetical protein
LNANPAGTAANGNPGSTAYKDTSIFLYGELSGDKNFDGAVNASDDLVNGAVIPKIYMAFKPDQLAWTDQTLKTAPILFLADPWGNSYGYSTAYQKWVDDGSKGNANGYNPTFDLWSTAGSNKPPTTTPATDVTPQWIKNW